MSEQGIAPYGLAGNWCEECGRAKSYRLFPGTLTGCKTCDDVITRHRCTSRPGIDAVEDGTSWECPDCGSAWTAGSRTEPCPDCCGDCGHQVTRRLWTLAAKGPRVDSAPRYEPEPWTQFRKEPWTQFRNALRQTVGALLSRPARPSRPQACYRTRGGFMVHVKPGCRCR